LGTQVRILKSKSLAWTVVEELRLDKDPLLANRGGRFHFRPPPCPQVSERIEQITPECRDAILETFAKSLTVDSIPRTQAVEITFRSANPTLAREVVNHLVSAYSRRVFMTRYDDTMKASDWLQGQLGQIKAAAEDAQSRLSKFQRDTGIFGTDENDNLVLSKLDDLSKELTDAEADRILKEAQYRIAKSGNPELIGTIVPDSVLPVLRSQEADLKDKLTQANSEYGPNYPAFGRSQLVVEVPAENDEIVIISQVIAEPPEVMADRVQLFGPHRSQQSHVVPQIFRALAPLVKIFGRRLLLD